MVIVMVVAAVLIVAAAAAVVVVRRRGRLRATSASGAATTSVLAQHPDPGPMTGLEDALNTVTDASGHTLAERLDDESSFVDELRVPDDTGPLLRRVLDSIETPDAEGDDDSTAGQNDA